MRRLTIPVIFLLFLCLIFFPGCAPKPYSASNKVYKEKAKLLSLSLTSPLKDSIVADSLKLPNAWVGTVNFNLRKPNFVILHHTAQDSCGETLRTFTLEATQVSAHYVICKDGTLFHMLNDYLRAWHAGISKWGNITDINSSSIGIEIDNNGTGEFTEAQLNTLLGLLATLKKVYNIPVANFIGHADVAPSRKVDPQINFPWKRLADDGYGHWYGDTTDMVLSSDFNPVYALRIIGYDVSDLTNTILAFRRHFLQNENTGALTEPEKKILFALVKKYL
jgi:N-acetylmuramoyl-L-alanine amidase